MDDLGWLVIGIIAWAVALIARLAILARRLLDRVSQPGALSRR
jgi:hypothetical protein